MKTLTVNDFHKLGLLQEINRKVLHPLGLALCVEINSEGEAIDFGEIMDCRDDPEGVMYDAAPTEELRQDRLNKIQSVMEMSMAKSAYRVKKFGWNVQTIESLLSL